MKGFSAQTELIAIIVLFMLFMGFVTGYCGNPLESDPSPRDEAEHECEVAYEEARDGDGDDPEAIYKQQWCRDHNDAEEQMAIMEREQELLEAEEDLQEAQTESPQQTETPTTQQASGGDYEVLYVESHEGEAP